MGAERNLIAQPRFAHDRQVDRPPHCSPVVIDAPVVYVGGVGEGNVQARLHPRVQAGEQVRVGVAGLCF